METTLFKIKQKKGPVLLDASFAGMILFFVVPAVIVGLIAFFTSLSKSKGSDFTGSVLAETMTMSGLFFLGFLLFNSLISPYDAINKQRSKVRKKSLELRQTQDKANIQFAEGNISKEKRDDIIFETNIELYDLKTQSDEHVFRKMRGDYANTLFRFIFIINILTFIMAFVVRKKTFMVSLLLFSALLLIFNYTNDFLINPFA